MSALSKRTAEVEQELGADWKRYHVGAQVSRFLTGVLATALWSMNSGFNDWTDLLPLLGTAAWTTVAQMWPQVPWSLLRDRFGVEKPAPRVTAVPAPPTDAPQPPGPAT